MLSFVTFSRMLLAAIADPPDPSLVTTLSATLLADTEPVQTSTGFTFSLIVNNTGIEDATSLSAVITLDSDLTFVSVTAVGTGWTCGHVGNVVTCTRTSLPTGAAPTILIAVTSPATYQTTTCTGTISASNVLVPVALSVQSEVIQWEYDVLKNLHRPGTTAEFTRFLAAKGLGSSAPSVGVPSSIYRCQAASGNLADTGAAGVTLTANASPGYQQSVTGCTFKGVRLHDATNERFVGAAGVGPNPATTGSAGIALLEFFAAPTTTRIFLGACVQSSATGVRLGIDSLGRVSMGVCGVSVTATPIYAGGVHMIGWVYDRTTPRAALIHDLNATAATYAAGAVDANKGLGSPNGGAANVAMALHYRWDGAASVISNADMKTLIQTMGIRNTAPETVFVDPTTLGHLDVAVLSPANYSTTTHIARPLLIIAGGYGSPTGPSSLTASGWNSLINYGDGAIIMPLTGRINSLGNHYWNVDPTAADIDGAGGDDCLYGRAAIDWALGQYNIDRTRIFFVGRSNGGFFAHAMAARHSDVVTAIVDIGGQGRSVAPLTGATPVHALIDHSVADPSVDFYGIANGINGVPYISTAVTLAQRATQNGSSGLALTTAAAYDHDSAVAGNETDRYTYAVNTGATTEHWREATSGHLFAFTAQAGTITTTWGQHAWDWLMAHPRLA